MVYFTLVSIPDKLYFRVLGSTYLSFYAFIVFETFPIVFEERRGLSASNDSLIFIGIGIGAVIGALLNIYLDGNTPEIIMKWQNSPPPENRLYGAMVGGPLLVVGIFWLGWTGEYSIVPWYVPALSTLLLGASISLVFISFTVSGNRLL
jgi:DHA1 family multidrug resistance protein-like MFS transporter